MNKKILSVSIVVADYYKGITDSLTNAAVEHLKNNKKQHTKHNSNQHTHTQYNKYLI